MRFGPVPVGDAIGSVLAHTLRADDLHLKKGRVLTPADVAALMRAGLDQVVVATPDDGDVLEDEAATILARALVPNPDAACVSVTRATTGRVNLNAVGPGIVELDADAIFRMNSLHPEITLATLAPMTRVTRRMLVATVKIISYAVPRADLDRACQVVAGAIRVRPVVRRSAGLVLTTVPGQKESLNAKAQEAVSKRLSALGVDLVEVREVPHDAAAIGAALRDLGGEVALILTGSATSDLYDTGPEGLRAAGGHVARFGLPVDPGNLLFHGAMEGRPVIGLPGCARSPALNGADWVLERIVCGLDIHDADVAAMGVGGLLKEIPSRPHPREG